MPGPRTRGSADASYTDGRASSSPWCKRHPGPKSRPTRARWLFRATKPAPANAAQADLAAEKTDKMEKIIGSRATSSARWILLHIPGAEKADGPPLHAICPPHAPQIPAHCKVGKFFFTCHSDRREKSALGRQRHNLRGDS